jgi:CheY-like chemotaxis protein
MNILIIEDEILIQKSLIKLLSAKGHNVIGCTLGKEAIKLIAQQDFDRIICDLMLQDVSGFDIIEESKSKYSAEEISQLFLIITAYSSEQVLEKARSYNCAILNKPFTNMNEALELMTRSKGAQENK